jgi:hypothetical protein
MSKIYHPPSYPCGADLVIVAVTALPDVTEDGERVNVTFGGTIVSVA